MGTLENLKPEIISGQLLQRLNDSLVFAQVANTDYQGEITSYGQSVQIVEVGPVTVNSYTMGSTSDITVEQLDTAAKVLQINQASYYGFTIDDADNAQARVKILNDGISQAAWELRDDIDAYIAALKGDAGVAVGGNATTGVDITSTNVLVYFMEAARKLDETNTPEAGRWAVVPPWLAHKATLAGIVQKTDNDAVFGSGYLGEVYGFRVYKSNNISATSGTDRYPALFGYQGSISMAVQVLSSEVVRPSKQFVTLAKGLVVYGAKVTRPNNLGVLYADYTSEAT
jgi:hypothetical protein